MVRPRDLLLPGLEGRASYSGGLDLLVSPGLLVFLVCPSRMGAVGSGDGVFLLDSLQLLERVVLRRQNNL